MARTVIARLSLPKAADWRPSGADLLYYQESDDNIFLICVGAGPLPFSYTTPLVPICSCILDAISQIASSKEAIDIFRKGPSDQELFENALDLVDLYIQHVATVAYHMNYLVLKEATIGYIKRTINPLLTLQGERDGGKTKAIPINDNTLRGLKRRFPSADLPLVELLEGVDTDFSKLRRGMLLDQRSRLTPERLVHLPAESKDLCTQYKEAGKRLRTAYKSGDYKTTHESWDQFKDHFLEENFPQLTHAQDIEKRGVSASYLANAQLAWRYGYKPSYMKKLVEEQKSKS